MTQQQQRYSCILILGAPGSGKATQGVVLGQIPRFHHLACADVFRSLDTRTPLGRQFIGYSSKGEPIPDDLTVQLWQENIHQRVDSHAFKPDIDFLVLDGIPRNVDQACMMDSHIDVLQVFHLACLDQTELARRMRKRALKDNRFDDANEQVIQQRLRTYEEETKPVLDHYAGIRMDIDASQAPAKVLFEILAGVMRLPLWQERSKIEI